MRVMYIPGYREWIIDIAPGQFRVTISHHKYLIEKIEQPSKELKYIGEYNTLGLALEVMMRYEMEEQE